jgi:hypothetical protein
LFPLFGGEPAPWEDTEPGVEAVAGVGWVIGWGGPEVGRSTSVGEYGQFRERVVV